MTFYCLVCKACDVQAVIPFTEPAQRAEYVEHHEQSNPDHHVYMLFREERDVNVEEHPLIKDADRLVIQ